MDRHARAGRSCRPWQNGCLRSSLYRVLREKERGICRELTGGCRGKGGSGCLQRSRRAQQKAGGGGIAHWGRVQANARERAAGFPRPEARPISFSNMTSTPEPSGCLVYVMGPSGAGKDTLIGYARARVEPAAVIFAHRYITRPPGAGGENHITLSEKEFVARRDAGMFALSWNSYGLWYGIGVEIDLWLARGLVVVVSGSRTAWPMAQARYSNLRGLVVDAPAESRAARLAERGREDERAVRARLEREVALPPGERLRLLYNDGPVAAAGEQFVDFLRSLQVR